MAKPPKLGSKVRVADFVTKKISKSGKLKVIQPLVVSYFDKTFYWIARIIFIGQIDKKVGIIRKIEAGYAIVSENDSGKLNILDLVISKELKNHIDAKSG